MKASETQLKDLERLLDILRIRTLRYVSIYLPPISDPNKVSVTNKAQRYLQPCVLNWGISKWDKFKCLVFHVLDLKGCTANTFVINENNLPYCAKYMGMDNFEIFILKHPVFKQQARLQIP